LISILICTVSLITGCSTTPKKEPLPPPVPAPVVEKPKGVYHKVAKQESLWRIAKTYGVSLDEIVKANNIPNAAVIEENQLVFVPGATEMLKIVLDKTDGKPDEFAWPLKGRVISYFNDAKGQSFNHGIDIAAAQGEEILAVREGNVVFADYLGGYGYTVIMDHLDGFYSVYARQSDVLVKSGQTVSKGTPLGRLAKSGQAAFLHFEIRKMQEPNNPLYYLP
jgi:murein DD-endopeptidase MepM/ murein hydrolase activator NlpD